MGTQAGKTAIVIGFAVIYVVWGSTYLAIRIGLETMPPFLLAGARFLVAGSLLYVWLRSRGAPRPSDAEWWAAAATGALMLVGGVGGVTWAEQRVPSGIACLLITTVPLWITLLESLILRQTRAGWRVGTGLALGLAGVAVLVRPGPGPDGTEQAFGSQAGDSLAAVVIVISALSWSLGSLVSRRARLPSSPAMTVAIQMLAAGVILTAISAASGELGSGLEISALSARSLGALAYLVVFGSIIALCAYVWLLRQVPASAVATYAFVNPLVAVLLGWAVLDEPIGREVLLATALIVGAVVLIQSRSWRLAGSSIGPAARSEGGGLDADVSSIEPERETAELVKELLPACRR